jgi:hypothetical protein
MGSAEEQTMVMAPAPRRSWWSGKPRQLDDLYRDPALLFNSAHMAGRASLIAHWLTTRQEPISPEEARQMGEALAESCSWFYEDAKPGRR